MKKRLDFRFVKHVLLVFCWFVCMAVCRLDVNALTLDFDKTTQEVIVAGVPETDENYNYSVNGYLKYGDERVESFCYGTASIGYDIPEAQAYVFSYADIEFILPCSGTYVMTAWIETRDAKTWEDLGKSQKTSLEFYYQKADESTNWGPGLPETMVEDWEIADLQGKNKDMVVSGGSEEYPYTWTIHGEDIYNVPPEDQDVNLEILSMDARFDAYIPGSEEGTEPVSIRLDIAHSGDFGFHAKLDYTLGVLYAGRYANLFYVLEPGKYEFVQSCQIDANGVATFMLNHASSYFVVIQDDAYTGEAIVEPTPAPTATPEPTAAPTPEATVTPDAAPTEKNDGTGAENADTATGTVIDSSDRTGSNTAEAGNLDRDNGSAELWWIIGIAVVILAAFGAGVYFWKKKRSAVEP